LGSRLKVWNTKPTFWLRMAASWKLDICETSRPGVALMLDKPTRIG